MKKFLRYLILLILPFVLVLTPVYCILYQAGELHNFSDSLIELDEHQLLGLAYTDVNQAYKYQMTKRKKPEVLALGTSRIMQVRYNVINPDYIFYNAGGAAGSAKEFTLFLNKLCYKPDLLIVNLDQFGFNPNITRISSEAYILEEPSELSIGYRIKICLNFMTDLLRGKLTRDVFTSHNIGVRARVKGSGFAFDGAQIYFSELYPRPSNDARLSDTKQRIRSKRSRFEPADHMDLTLLEKYDDFLSYCQRKGIKVIAIIPPFAPSINKLLRADGNYGYMDEIYPNLSPIFNRHESCYLFNFRDVDGSVDENYVDGFHGDVFVYNHILSSIIRSTPELSIYFRSVSEIDSISETFRNSIPFN